MDYLEGHYGRIIWRDGIDELLGGEFIGKRKEGMFEGQRDKELILFLAEYGSITNENVQVLYDSKYYYKNRLASFSKKGAK